MASNEPLYGQLSGEPPSDSHSHAVFNAISVRREVIFISVIIIAVSLYAAIKMCVHDNGYNHHDVNFIISYYKHDIKICLILIIRH